jgi:hypothetical protein
MNQYGFGKAAGDLPLERDAAKERCRRSGAQSFLSILPLFQ